MRTIGRSGLFLACLAGAAAAAPAQAPRIDLSERALVAAASAYVTEYEKQFAFLIADEEYTQTRFGADNQMLQRRLMRSELFLTYLPVDGEWIAVRDVIEVDGVPLQNREDLRVMLSRRESWRGLAAQLVARNARYNIGLIERNFNEPTLPLLLLEPKRVKGVKFDRKGVSRQGDATLATLNYSERDRPTLVTGPGGSLPGKGEIQIDAATGAVRYTTFELARPGVKVKLATTYDKDAKLDLWLPARFTERYETQGLLGELITGEATYTNYRRFEVTGRIK